MGAQQSAGCEGRIDVDLGNAGRALRYRPLRRQELLRLHGAEGSHDVVDRPEGRAPQMLAAHPAVDEISHAGSVTATADGARCDRMRRA